MDGIPCNEAFFVEAMPASQHHVGIVKRPTAQQTLVVYHVHDNQGWLMGSRAAHFFISDVNNQYFST